MGQFVKEGFEFEYFRSRLIMVMNRIGFIWKKPEAMPGKIDAEAQRNFIAAREDLRNCLARLRGLGRFSEARVKDISALTEKVVTGANSRSAAIRKMSTRGSQS